MSTEKAESNEASNKDASIDVIVRPATRADMQHVLDMIQELAEYEGAPEGVKITTEDLVRDGFESSYPWFSCLIATCSGSGEVLGHVMYNRAYSSWTHRSYYIEDLYVRPAARGKRVGIRLLHHLCKLAVSENVHRVDWHVLETNDLALRFYSQLGARDLHITENRAAMRLDRPNIEKLANENL